MSEEEEQQEDYLPEEDFFGEEDMDYEEDQEDGDHYQAEESAAEWDDY